MDPPWFEAKHCLPTHGLLERRNLGGFCHLFEPLVNNSQNRELSERSTWNFEHFNYRAISSLAKNVREIFYHLFLEISVLLTDEGESSDTVIQGLKGCTDNLTLTLSSTEAFFNHRTAATTALDAKWENALRQRGRGQLDWNSGGRAQQWHRSDS